MKRESRVVAELSALPIPERDHIQGPSDAPIMLLEYGDYECPYCGKAYPVVKQIQSELNGRLRFAFRNFPLNTIHPHASVAAQAAEAAAAQGKFWEMHDLLYEHQDELAEADMVQYALKVGLEVYRFEADLASEVFAPRVREDLQSGIRSGVNGTPTFFINGVRYDGSWDEGHLLRALEHAAR